MEDKSSSSCLDSLTTKLIEEQIIDFYSQLPRISETVEGLATLRFLGFFPKNLYVKGLKCKIYQSVKDTLLILSLCIQISTDLSFKKVMFVAIYIKTLNYERIGTVKAVLKNHNFWNSATQVGLCHA